MTPLNTESRLEIFAIEINEKYLNLYVLSMVYGLHKDCTYTHQLERAHDIDLDLVYKYCYGYGY